MSIGRVKSCWAILVLTVIIFPDNSILKLTDNVIDEYQIEERQDPLLRSIRALPSKKQPNLSGEACHGYNGQKGRCLALENCVLQPLKENYIKYKAYYCITSENTVGVCCPNNIAIPDVYEERTFNRQGSNTARRRSSRSLRRPLSRFRRNVADEVNTCGRNGRLLTQVAKDGLVENKAWPWVVSIVNADTLEHHCGATLISRFHILSAAHCFYYGGKYVLKERVKARLGEYDFKKTDDSSFNDYDIADIIIHEKYDEPTHENDIALVVLARPARYTIYAQPACMPKPGEEYEGKTAVVVGWGLLEFAGPTTSVLREVQVPVWNYQVCANNYLQTIFETNVCAAGYEGGKDSCQGDSGGPLVVQRQDGRWEIIGVVSWGVQCGLKGKPGIYAQVNKYYDWLNEKSI